MSMTILTIFISIIEGNKNSLITSKVSSDKMSTDTHNLDDIPELDDQPVIIPKIEEQNPSIETIRETTDLIVGHGFYSENSKLMCAVKYGQLQFVKYLIELDSNTNVNCFNLSGQSPLMIAAECGNIEMVKYLVKHNANINHQDCKGETALEYAILNGRLNVVRYLIQMEHDVNLKEWKNQSLIFRSKGKMRPSWFETTYGDRWTLLMIAVKNKQVDILCFLLDVIPPNEKQKYLDADNRFGYTALMIAAQSGHLEILKILLDNGSSINNQTKFGITAVIIAAERGNKEILKYLLEKGADPIIGKRIKKTPRFHCIHAYEPDDFDEPNEYERGPLNTRAYLSIANFYSKQINNLRGNRETYFNIIPKDICNLICNVITNQL